MSLVDRNAGLRPVFLLLTEGYLVQISVSPLVLVWELRMQFVESLSQSLALAVFLFSLLGALEDC